MKKKVYNLAILVVLYNKEFDESNTLRSLLFYVAELDNCKLEVWNNGPSLLSKTQFLDCNNKGLEINVTETIHNESLAVIYNQFIDKNLSKQYVILDDDSVLSSGYIKAIANQNVQVGVPIAMVGEKIISPRGQGNKMTAVGSGLVIDDENVSKIKMHFGDCFDEKFNLYGVDTTFFYRLQKLKLMSEVTILPTIEHSQSAFEEESKEIKHFRLIQLSYAKGLEFRRYFYESGGVVSLVTLLGSTLIKRIFGIKVFISAKSVLYTFLTGKRKC